MDKINEQCCKCFHFQVCASVLKNDLFIREVMLGEKEPKCKMYVEIVQCKDCKHYSNQAGVCRWYRRTKFDEGFCDRGERRTENADD